MTDWKNIKIASPYDETPDAPMAAEDELNHVILTQNVPENRPQRFNPAIPYIDASAILNDRDEILLQAVKKAIDNGWIGYKSRINDAMTLGMEAEQLVKEMKRTKANVRDLLFDHEFAEALWGEEFKEKLQAMVLEPDVILYVKEHL